MARLNHELMVCPKEFITLIFRLMMGVGLQGRFLSSTDSVLNDFMSSLKNLLSVPWVPFVRLVVKNPCVYHSSADSLALYQLASQCPGVHGNAVYQAAALYYSIYQVPVYFNCEEVGGRFAQESIKTTPNDRLKIIPNPNQGDFVVKIPEKYKGGTLYVFDTIGRQLYKEDNGQTSENTLRLKLAPGTYLLRATKIGVVDSIQKIIITE